jgi:hypothetical protein
MSGDNVDLLALGAFRINPPANKSVNNSFLYKSVTFEYFVCSDVKPQPNFEYMKREIAKAVSVLAMLNPVLVSGLRK